jgi:large subunit ribosomal protein L6
MSKIGKKPIVIPKEAKVEMLGGVLKFNGKNAELKVKIPHNIKAEIKDDKLIFSLLEDTRQARSNWGTVRALSENALLGSMKDFIRELKIEGVGYRAVLEGDKLILNVGFSHQIRFPLPEGIKASVEKNIIKISGADKFLVGETAARIRRVKKPEPYQGKGIMYTDEVVRRKAGKKVAGASAA